MELKLVSQTPSAHIVTATKPLVDALLAMNTSNRKVRQSAVQRMRVDIESGAWRLTASGIGVDIRGVTSDGQHRLLAIKEAGYPPVQFVLVVGLSPDAQAVVDRHAKRSLADALSLLHGRTISTALVAASNAMLSITNSTSRSDPFSSRLGRGVSDAEAAANLLDWEDDITACIAATAGLFRASVCAALAIYHRHDQAGALLLADQMRKGVGLSESDPAYRLRAVLANSPQAQGGQGGSFRAFAYTVSAVIAHANRQSLRMLKQSESWARAPWKEWKA